MTLRALTLACSALAAATLMPAHADTVAPGSAADTAAAADGKALYQEHCRKCHGSDGQSRTVKGYLYFARDFTRPAWQATRSDEDIFRVISDSPGWWSTMPAFGKRLSDAERHALVRVVRDLGTPTPP